uniref:Uncharacterized protein n=1 Tax=Chromera velia CCMP2878 TaxID=1169474 RepID=A0A0G4GJ39_9ALVE
MASSHPGPFKGTLKYQSENVSRSLRSNGKVYSNRDSTGTDSPPVGVEQIEVSVSVESGRKEGEERPRIHREGFELLPSVCPDMDLFDDSVILEQYYPHVETLLKEKLGAAHVFAFDHNLRSSSKGSWMHKTSSSSEEDGKGEGDKNAERLKGGNLVQSPVAVVHGDLTLTSAPRRLEMLAEAPRENDTLRRKLGDAPLISADLVNEAVSGKRRFACVNVWRSVGEGVVKVSPLAMCDCRSVGDGDLVTFEVRYSDRTGENYLAGHSEGHRWTVDLTMFNLSCLSRTCLHIPPNKLELDLRIFPEMNRDEVVLLKCWDSEGDFAKKNQTDSQGGGFAEPFSTFALHSAIELTDTSPAPDAPARKSLEVRTVVIF